MSGPFLPATTDQPGPVGPMPPATRQASNMTIFQRGSGQIGSISPRSIHQELYLAKEELMRGDPIWEWIGRHIAAYQTRKQAEQSLEDLARLRKEAYVRSQELLIDAELTRHQAEFDDAILQEHLMRCADMMASYLDALQRLFASDRYTDLPEEVKAELISRLYVRAEQMVFGSPTPSINGQTSNDSDRKRPIIIDADEF